MRLVDSSVVAALLMVRASAAASQAPLESVARDSAPPRHFCFTPAPRSRCRSFLALDGGYTLRVVGTKRDVFNRAIASEFALPMRDLVNYVHWDVGIMRNVDSAHAVGADVQLGWAGFMLMDDGNAPRFAVRARRRTFLRDGLARDAALGVVVTRMARAGAPYGMPLAIGATGDFQLIGPLDRVPFGVMLGADVATNGERVGAAAHVGLRTQSRLTATLTAVQLVAVALLGTIMYATNDCLFGPCRR